MPTWEYLRVNEVAKGPLDFTKYGERGWELVCRDEYFGQWILKRPIDFGRSLPGPIPDWEQ